MSSQIMLCVDLYAERPIAAREVFELLLRSGWQLVHNGEIEHLPLGDKGMYDWIWSRMAGVTL